MTDKLTPEERLASLYAKCRPVRTPCGDGTMAWQLWGQETNKTPLILVHGGFGSWTHWVANVERLSKDRLVVTLDIPGLGDSDEIAPPINPMALAQPIIAGLDTVIGEGTRFDVAAFSFGSVISSQVLKQVGERCRTMVFTGGSGFQGMHHLVTGTIIPGPDETEESIKETHKKNLGILMLWNEDKIDDFAVYTHALNIARARVRSRKMSLSNTTAEALPDIKARLAGIWGIHDATGGGRERILARRDLMRQYQAEVPFHIIEEAGHWVMYEAPEVYEAALLQILDGA